MELLERAKRVWTVVSSWQINDNLQKANREKWVMGQTWWWWGPIAALADGESVVLVVEGFCGVPLRVVAVLGAKLLVISITAVHWKKNIYSSKGRSETLFWGYVLRISVKGKTNFLSKNSRIFYNSMFFCWFYVPRSHGILNYQITLCDLTSSTLKVVE